MASSSPARVTAVDTHGIRIPASREPDGSGPLHAQENAA
jgi:hypothetical protein